MRVLVVPAAAARRPRRAGKPAAGTARAEPLDSALQYFDGPFDCTKLAVRKSFEFAPERRPAGDTRTKLVATFLRKAKGETPAVLRILSPLDKAGANECVDRSAYGGR